MSPQSTGIRVSVGTTSTGPSPPSGKIPLDTNPKLRDVNDKTLRTYKWKRKHKTLYTTLSFGRSRVIPAHTRNDLIFPPGPGIVRDVTGTDSFGPYFIV